MHTQKIPLRYEKGEDRWKHVGRKKFPEIVYENGNPKVSVGKCPSEATISDKLKETLLNEAIAGDIGNRDADFAKTLYVVHEGAIYAAQTSDSGMSYHGYPFRGRMSGALLDELSRMAKKKGCYKEFSSWVKTHITKHGSRG